MNSTSESLLVRLRSSDDQLAWSKFVELYTPLLFYWARKTGLQTQDAADLVQDVLAIVFQKLPDFSYDPAKSFRGWMRTITLNRHRELCRKRSIGAINSAQSALTKVSKGDVDPKEIWEANYRGSLISQALAMMQSEFEPSTWKALKSFVIDGQLASKAAEEAGVSVWTVYSAKSRLLAKLRHQLDGLLD